MIEKTYHGIGETWGVEVHLPNGSIARLDPRYDLRNHSPDGFSWGYSGSGPAQLALALCCDVLADDGRAQRIYQDFKRIFVALLPQHRPWNARWAELDQLMKNIERDCQPL